MRSRLFVYLCLSMFLACTTKPVYVLSDKKMENVLFDLYIAEVEINENSGIFYNDSAKKQDLLQSVFKKHKISQARFDTSLVWYNANLKRYLKVNDQVTGRYNRWIDNLEAQIQKERRFRSNKFRFEDTKLQDVVTPFLSLWKFDFSALPVDTIRQDTIVNALEPISRFERVCFYQDTIVTSPEPACRFERVSFYQDE